MFTSPITDDQLAAIEAAYTADRVTWDAYQQARWPLHYRGADRRAAYDAWDFASDDLRDLLVDAGEAMIAEIRRLRAELAAATDVRKSDGELLWPSPPRPWWRFW